MEGQAVKEITTLAQKAAGQETLVKLEDGTELSTTSLHRPPLDHMPDAPDTLTLHTLQGLVDYIEANRDDLKAEECMVHVLSPTRVRLVSRLQPRAARFTYLEARAEDLIAGWLGTRQDLEEANIALQARFVDAHDRAKVLSILGNVHEDAELRVQDDGVSQKVKTKAGVHLATEGDVPNPVTLAPYRTFREVKQPASKFVLRLHSGNGGSPSMSLHESDGGQWQLEAVESVAAWLDERVGNFAVIR